MFDAKVALLSVRNVNTSPQPIDIKGLITTGLNHRIIGWKRHNKHRGRSFLYVFLHLLS